MARNRIAEAYVELKARGGNAVRAALKGVNKDLKDTDRSADKAGSRLDRMAGAGERLQSIVGKLLLPVAFVTAIAGAIAQFTRLSAEAEKTQKQMRDLSAGARDFEIAARQAAGSFGSADAETVQRIQEIRGELEKFDELARQIQERSQTDPFGNLIKGIGNLVADDTFDTASEQLDEISRRQDQASQRLKAAEDQLEAARARREQNRAEIARAENDVLQGRSSRLVEILQLEQQIAETQGDAASAYKEALEERLQIIEDLYARERQAALESNRQILRDFERTQRQVVSSLFDSQSQSFKRIEDLLARQINKLEQIRKLPR